MDMIPGSVTYYWFTPTRTGTSRSCAPSCAARAMPSCAAWSWSTPQEDYLAWLGEQQTFAQLTAPQQTGAAE